MRRVRRRAAGGRDLAAVAQAISDRATVEIPDTLLDEARKLATRQDITLRVLIIEGLRRVVAERKRLGTFNLRKATFAGNGLQPDAAGASWDRIRGMAYEDRGG